MVNDLFIELVQIAVGKREVLSRNPTVMEWFALKSMADRQYLCDFIEDALDVIPVKQRPPEDVLLKWIGEVFQSEAIYGEQLKVAVEMANLFENNGIKTYVLKGLVIAECYPRAEHRLSADLDCILQSSSDYDISEDVWEKGNKLIEESGCEVKRDYYKNSTFLLPDLMVENHRFITPFRGNRRLKELECYLQTLLYADGMDNSKDEKSLFDGSFLRRPPVMVTALFLIEHAYSHFLHEGLTWRYVLDWMMFSEKHKKEIDWYTFEALIEEFGFKKFYYSFERLGKYILGNICADALSEIDMRMLEDIWSNLDLQEKVHGIRGKFWLVKKTWKARRKYHYFSEISMLHALWIQIKGFLFIRNPRLA